MISFFRKTFFAFTVAVLIFCISPVCFAKGNKQEETVSAIPCSADKEQDDEVSFRITPIRAAAAGCVTVLFIGSQIIIFKHTQRGDSNGKK